MQAAAQLYPVHRLMKTLVDTRGESVVSTQALLVANFLEVLRFHHALNVLVPSGRATRKGDYFVHGKKTLSFTDILQDFLSVNGLTQWDSRFTAFRNAAVHGEEIRGATLLDRFATVLDVLHLCDRVMLEILRWHTASGKYIPCISPERKTPTSYGINSVQFP